MSKTSPTAAAARRVAPTAGAKTARRGRAKPVAARLSRVDPSGDLPASLRALEVLRAVADSHGKASLPQLAATCDLSKPTVHRLCTFLTEAGFLRRDVEPGMFTVGPSFRKLAFDALTSRVEQGLQHAVLSAMADEVGETCNLTTLDGTEIVYLDRVEARWPLRLMLDIGCRIPIHCCASGKLFLALMEPAACRSVLSRMEFERVTARTIVDRAVLEAELEEIRRRGYSLDNEEFIPGMVAIALPVRDAKGNLCATVSVHAPGIRMSLDELERRAARIGQWARKLEEAAGLRAAAR